MELHEFVTRAAHVDRAASRVVDLDRMAVIDDLQCRRLVIEFDRGQVRGFCAANVDRRLQFAELAGAELGAERGPGRGTAVTFVAPVVAALGQRRSGRAERAQEAEPNQCRRQSVIDALLDSAGHPADRPPAPRRRNRSCGNRPRIPRPRAGPCLGIVVRGDEDDGARRPSAASPCPSSIPDMPPSWTSSTKQSKCGRLRRPGRPPPRCKRRLDAGRAQQPPERPAKALVVVDQGDIGGGGVAHEGRPALSARAIPSTAPRGRSRRGASTPPPARAV